MDTIASQHVRRLALLTACGAGLVVAAAVYMALWTPGMLDLSVRYDTPGPAVVAWVAPNGPAWSAGVVPGDAIVGGAPRTGTAASLVVMRQGGHASALGVGPGATRVIPLDLADAGVGLCIVLFGTLVLAKGRDRRAAAAFWRMSALIGLTLGVVPAGFHGVLWAIAVTFIALTLFGPALLELSVVFPSTDTPIRRRPLIWLPALILLLLYPLCWWRPAPLFALVSSAGDIVLAGYIMAACAHLVWAWSRLHSALQRAQLQWLALGLICGFLPLVGLDLLPHLLVDRSLVPPQVSVLALVLLLLSVGIAIVRTDFLGITGLMRRRTLHLLLSVTLLAGIAVLAGWVTLVGPQRWGWPAPIIAAGASVLTALGYMASRPALARWAERLVLRDVYDTGDTVLRVSTDLAHAEAGAIGPLVVTHLGATLDLDFALLLTPYARSVYQHPRNPAPTALIEAVGHRAQELVATPQTGEIAIEPVQGVPVLFLPIRDGPKERVVLCCGPKHSGAYYTRQDRTLLRALGHYVAVLCHDQTVQDQLAELSVRLRAMQGTSEPLKPEELEVLPYVAQGLTSKEIGHKLILHKRTVEKRLTAIYRKWGVSGREEAVRVARQQGLLPPEGWAPRQDGEMQRAAPMTTEARRDTSARKECDGQRGQEGALDVSDPA